MFLLLRHLASFFALLSAASALNILVFLLGGQQHERAHMEYLAQALALRHHTVITVKPVLIPEEPRLVKPKLHLVREKTIKNMLSRRQYEPLQKVWSTIPWRAVYDVDEHLLPYYEAHNETCYKMLDSNLLQGLAHDNLDVMIAYAGNPCQLALAHVLGVPVIYYDLEGLTDETLVASRSPMDLDYPLSNCFYSHSKNSLVSRLAAGLCLLREEVAQLGLPLISAAVSRRYRLLDGPITKAFREDYEIKKRFAPFPDVNELKQSSALFFVNTDPLLEYERPLPPHVIPVGGLHLDLPRPLFAPWNESVKASKDGTIVVSFGTHANAAGMTEKQAKAVYNTLVRLDTYRIFWSVGPALKLPGIDIEKAPAHINITSFFPQLDLLAERRTRLLLTNGGPASLMEALAYGVPVVGIPLYGANDGNLKKAVYKGLGLVVSKDELSESTLFRTIKTVLDSSKYKTSARDMSRLWKSRSESAFERALRHIEHVGKQRGASFIRPRLPNGRGGGVLGVLRRLSLDFFFLLSLLLILSLSISLVIVYLLVVGAVQICQRLLARSLSSHQAEAKKKSN